jgi:hypothetical protein
MSHYILHLLSITTFKSTTRTTITCSSIVANKFTIYAFHAASAFAMAYKFTIHDTLWPNSRSPQQCEHNKFLRFCFFVLLFSLAITFLHSCNGNMSITAARNAWVGYSICLCVMEDKSCIVQWMVEEAIALKKVCGMDERR